MDLSNLLVPAMTFLALGLFAHLIRSDLKFLPDLTKTLTTYLLVGTGLHGGKEPRGCGWGPGARTLPLYIGKGDGTE